MVHQQEMYSLPDILNDLTHSQSMYTQHNADIFKNRFATHFPIFSSRKKASREKEKENLSSTEAAWANDKSPLSLASIPIF